MSDMSKNWYDVSRKGLAKLIERRGGGDGCGSQGGGKIALLLELIANALDADGVTRVEVVLEPEPGVPHATIVVRDDAPGGFEDITHARTLRFGREARPRPLRRGVHHLNQGCRQVRAAWPVEHEGTSRARHRVHGH